MLHLTAAPAGSQTSGSPTAAESEQLVASAGLEGGARSDPPSKGGTGWRGFPRATLLSFQPDECHYLCLHVAGRQEPRLPVSAGR